MASDIRENIKLNEIIMPDWSKGVCFLMSKKC